MKNLQKGSLKIGVMLVILIVIVGGGLYIYNNRNGCSITDSTGKTTYQNPCLARKADNSLNVEDNSDLGRIRQGIKEQESKYLPTAPEGFLKPNNLPSGYKPQGHPTLFEADSVEYFYTTNKGFPADKNLDFREKSTTNGSYENYNQYIASESKDPNSKLVKEFTYNGTSGKIFTYISNPNTNYLLVYDHGNTLIRITATNDSNITPDILIDLLKAMK